MEKNKIKLTVNIAIIAIAILSIALIQTSKNNSENMLTGNAVRTLAFCEDSDGGLNYPVKGTIRTQKGSPKSDSCVLKSNTLREFYCSGVDKKSEYHKCSVDCKEGACVETTTPPVVMTSCTDSDNGRNYAVSGYVREVLSSGETRDSYDACASTTTLTEYYCVNTAAQLETYNCPNGCSNGACTAQITSPPPPPLPPPVPGLV